MNWQPIRQPKRWEGSVWQQVYEGMQHRGDEAQLPDAEWTNAFMRRCETMEAATTSQGDHSVNPAASPKAAQKPQPPRILQGKAAFNADLRFAQLSRLGFDTVTRLSWAVVYSPTRASGIDCAGSSVASEESEVPEEALEALLGLLHCADGYEDLFVTVQEGHGGTSPASPTPVPMPPSEELLSQMLVQTGRLRGLQSWVADALCVERMPEEICGVERRARASVEAVRAVMASRALPQLLEGVLLLGNYVNSSTQSLGGAVAVTLDSLAKLAHTRCLQSDSVTDRVNSSPSCRSAQPSNALSLLAGQLQEKYGCTFLETLITELENCSSVRDVDPKAIQVAVRDVLAQVQSLESRIATSDCGETPPSLGTTRLQSFLANLRPQIEALESLAAEFVAVTAGCRKHFAEPNTCTLPEMLANLTSLLEPLRAARLPSVADAVTTPRPRQLARSRSVSAAPPLTPQAPPGAPRRSSSRRPRARSRPPEAPSETPFEKMPPFDASMEVGALEQAAMASPARPRDSTAMPAVVPAAEATLEAFVESTVGACARLAPPAALDAEASLDCSRTSVVVK